MANDQPQSRADCVKKDTVGLNEAFNQMSVAGNPGTDVIVIQRGDFFYRLDFTLRQQMTWFAPKDHATLTFGSLGFSQLDHEMLDLARNKLIEIGGNPPELPTVQPPSPSRPPGFTL